MFLTQGRLAAGPNPAGPGPSRFRALNIPPISYLHLIAGIK
jgi:hypothetical protein